MKLNNFKGKVFGRLTVLERDENDARGLVRWLCQCSCGTETSVPARTLSSGASKSCGCLRREVPHSITHHRTKTRLYRIWQGMKRRCQAPAHEAYHRYGARGITVCPEWQHFEPFEAWAIANGYSDELTLDRQDNDAGYSPDNCRWVSMLEQNNNRRDNQLLTHDGRTMTAREWSREIGISYPTLLTRIHSGWTAERALTRSVDMKRSSRRSA